MNWYSNKRIVVWPWMEKSQEQNCADYDVYSHWVNTTNKTAQRLGRARWPKMR